jgi:hypothetical protein
MAISSGRSKIDYEKIDEEDRLRDFIEHSIGAQYDISSAPIGDLTIASDLADCGVISDRSFLDYCGSISPRRTIQVQSQISPVQYMGLSPEYRKRIIEDAKRKLAESISESIVHQVSFRENMSYDGTITIEAEIDLDRF